LFFFIFFMENPNNNIVETICYKSKNYNILLIGDSRSGKSTFLELIKNNDYVVETEIFRKTRDPISDTLFLKYDNEYIHINFIDTPGFNEVGGSSRTNKELEELITNFIRKDVTKLNMVLITINGSSGINQLQLDSITNTIKYLGKQLTNNMILLTTHFDLKDELEEKDWINKFQQDENVEFLRMIIKNKHLFTGAIDKIVQKNTQQRDLFLLLQKKKE